LSSPTPADRTAPRFRLPVEPPTRHLLIASLSTIAGACQLFAWALARLPDFFLFFGIVLVVAGLGFALAALLRHYRLRWIVYVGGDSLTIVNGQRRTVLPWAKVGTVRYAGFRLEVTAADGSRLSSLPVDRTRPAHDAAKDVERAIAEHLPART
jgi:hypothetical protein